VTRKVAVRPTAHTDRSSGAGTLPPRHAFGRAAGVRVHYTQPVTEPDPLQVLDDNRVRWRGRVLIHFSGCDYFRLSRHPAVLRAAVAGLRGSGLNVAASRLTTGNHPVYGELEARLARFFGAPAALLVSNGYVTSTVVAQALAGEFSHVLLDERGHPALRDAALHCECPVRIFPHRSTAGLERAAGRCGPHARLLVMTDGMFSQDGSVAPLRDYLKVLPPNATLLVDDAHGAGVLGRTGRGTPEHERIGRRRLIQCVTLSKAFGAYGGAVLGSRALRQRILEHSRALVGSTALPPPLAHAALASLKMLQHGQAMRLRLHRNADSVKQALRRAGFDVPDCPGPIVAVQTTRPETPQLRRELLTAGIYPPLLRYPGAAQGLFRFVISSEHTRDQLDRLIAALIRFRGAGRPGAGTGIARTTAGPIRRPGSPSDRQPRPPRAR
jgi:glycine C-acetyltransferase/8-amino-7-oxononanoate synthase